MKYLWIVLFLVLVATAAGAQEQPATPDQQVAALQEAILKMHKEMEHLRQENDYLWQVLQTQKIKCN